jgi:hypothetical protein
MGGWQSGQLHQTVNLAPPGYGGSNPSPPKSNRERGRENVSFPVAENLKPQGFKERCDVRIPLRPKMQKIFSLKRLWLAGLFMFYSIYAKISLYKKQK